MQVLKIKLDDDIHRISVNPNDLTYSTLVGLIMNLFKESLQAPTFSVKYLDEDKDLITIAGDNDLKEALSQAQGKTLQLIISSRDSTEATPVLTRAGPPQASSNASSTTTPSSQPFDFATGLQSILPLLGQLNPQPTPSSSSQPVNQSSSPTQPSPPPASLDLAALLQTAGPLLGLLNTQPPPQQQQQQNQQPQPQIDLLSLLRTVGPLLSPQSPQQQPHAQQAATTQAPPSDLASLVQLCGTVLTSMNVAQQQPQPQPQPQLQQQQVNPVLSLLQSLGPLLGPNSQQLQSMVRLLLENNALGALIQPLLQNPALLSSLMQSVMRAAVPQQQPIAAAAPDTTSTTTTTNADRSADGTPAPVTTLMTSSSRGGDGDDAGALADDEHRTALRLLREMGFTQEALNREVLHMCAGDLTKAVQHLTSLSLE